MSKKIKNAHVLIIGSGSSLERYGEKIKKFIKENDVVTIGCNHISDFIIPDYHVWGDIRRYREFGKFMSKKSIAVFSRPLFTNEIVREFWNRPYKKIKYKNSKREYNKVRKIKAMRKNILVKKTNFNKEYAIRYKRGYIEGRFRTIGCLSIVWVFLKKAAKISIVGMDGYTLYKKEKYDNGIEKQHYYNVTIDNLHDFYETYKDSGYTDMAQFYRIGNKDIENKRKTKELLYLQCTIRDKDIYRNLKNIKKYGIKFSILTPTVYEEFYDPKILSIR